MRPRSVVLYGGTLLVLAAAVVVGLQARSSALRAQQELLAAKALLAQAGSPAAGELKARLALVDQAGRAAASAHGRLEGWPLRPLRRVPLAGRDLKVAAAVATSAGETVAATRAVVAGLEPLERGRLSAEALTTASAAMLELSRVVGRGTGRVQAAEPFLLTRSARAEFLTTGGSAARTAGAAGQGLRLAAKLYGPAGATRWFLGFQNPAELRGTGGLIGQYGILESSPSGPRLVHTGTWEELQARTRHPIALPSAVAARYVRFSADRDWRAVNTPPDLPTVSRAITRLYRSATGDRIDGVLMIDPLAVARVLEVAGPITVDGIRLTAANIAQETLVTAYVRWAHDNPARVRFLDGTSRATYGALQSTMRANPLGLVKALGEAAKGRHVQLWSADPAAQRALAGLGIAGSAAAPAEGDYLMVVGVNAAANKVDAFLHRRLSWDVRLAPGGSATAKAKLTLRNAVPGLHLPPYIVGPYNTQLSKGEQRQFQSLYVAEGYGFTAATQDGRPAASEPQPDFGATALSRYVRVPARRTVTLGYELERDGAAERVGGRLRCRLLVRPQATIRPDLVDLTVRAPTGWRVTGAPSGFRVDGATASWSGPLLAERAIEVWMAPPS